MHSSLNASGLPLARRHDLISRLIAAPSTLFLLLGTGVWLLFLSWVRPLTLPDEGRYGGVAWEMLSGGDSVTPTLDGLPYFHKPPLYYWLSEASYRIFGGNVWAARLPSWLAAWALAIGTYYFLRRWRGAKTATLALIVLITQPFFFGGAQFANMDMLVAGLIGLTTLCAASAVLSAYAGQPYRLQSFSAGLLAGLAVLAKGLIGLLLPGAVLVLWLLIRRRYRGFALLLWPPAIIAFLVVTTPWFWVMQTRFPGFLHYFFVYQQFERFADSGFNNVQPFWFYVPVIAAMALPWTFWLGGALRAGFWRNPRLAAPERGDAAPEDNVATATADTRWLMVSWIAIILVFFSIPSSKLVGYVLPLLPALAAIVADVIAKGLAGSDKDHDVSRHLLISVAAAIVLCILGTGIAALNAKPNSVSLGRMARDEVKATDTVLALHAYPYDLPMAMRLQSAMWIVDEWTQTDIPLRDNWRKELYDAGQFHPSAMQQNLISEAEMVHRMCAAAPGSTFWIWGEPTKDAARYRILYEQHPRYASGKRALWRVVTDATFKQQNCA